VCDGLDDVESADGNRDESKNAEGVFQVMLLEIIVILMCMFQRPRQKTILAMPLAIRPCGPNAIQNLSIFEYRSVSARGLCARWMRRA
jgi:hypothetical protein